MKKNCRRLFIEVSAAREMLHSCEKAEKPRLYIRYLAAMARCSMEGAVFWSERDKEISRYYTTEILRFETMIMAAKTMREYVEGAQ